MKLKGKIYSAELKDGKHINRQELGEIIIPVDVSKEEIFKDTELKLKIHSQCLEYAKLHHPTFTGFDVEIIEE